MAEEYEKYNVNIHCMHGEKPSFYDISVYLTVEESIAMYSTMHDYQTLLTTKNMPIGFSLKYRVQTVIDCYDIKCIALTNVVALSHNIPERVKLDDYEE